MSAITRAIASHDLQGIADALKAHPEQVSERHQGWLPIEWAERGGNVVTLARTARILQSAFVSLSAQSVLKSYFNLITATEFETIQTEKAVEMIWSTVFNEEKYKVDRWQRPLIASAEHEQDIRYLIDMCNIKSAKEFLTVLTNA